ncbi:MAG: metallophosphoesterase family protein [Paludibacteraceae bacterium]
MKQKIVYIIALTVCCSCDIDWSGLVAPPSDTVNQRFEQSQTWNDTHAAVRLSVPIDNYTFYVGTDIHTETTTDNLTNMITAMRNDENAYFALLLGDLVHGQGHFATMANALPYNADTQARNDTVFTTVGNHDLYFDQWNDYRNYFGTATYAFEVQTPNYTDLFVSIDTGSGTLGNKQTAWFEQLLAAHDGHHRHTIVFTHTNIFKDDNTGFPTSNMALEETFALTALLQQYHVTLYLQGHNHYRHDFLYRDVRYITVETMQDKADAPYYLTATMGDKQIDYQFVSLRNP